MKDKAQKQEWLLLVHLLPPRPTNLRVRIWRKLQRLGAVAVKNSVYLLPFNEKTHEDFQWLKQEIETEGGEVTVFRAGAVEGATDKEIIALFCKTRDDEYVQLVAELDGFTGALREQKRGGHLSVGRIAHYETELDKLHKELERIVGTDFFTASRRTTAMAAYERCQKALRAAQSRPEKPAQASALKGVTINLAAYQGRRWVTRRNLFIDRLAAIWLIKRFVDAKARISFVAESETVEGAIGFDMYGGEFTHRGENCTFETMISHFGLSNDVGLQELAEIVHDIDLKDNKFNRSEAAGLSTVIRGLAESLKADRKLVQQCGPLFDGLYELLARERKTTGREKDGRKQARRNTSKRSKRSARK
jgi:hypothetical protein